MQDLDEQLFLVFDLSESARRVSFALIFFIFTKLKIKIVLTIGKKEKDKNFNVTELQA